MDTGEAKSGVSIPADRAEYKYWAFISYSHRDTAWARWLHRQLEGYRVPKTLVGRPSRNGPVPPRLIPIFRDRDELSASYDLGIYIKSSLVLSRCVVVICSPNAAKSKFVDDEIRYFKTLGRGHQVFCLIVGGEPEAADKLGQPDMECFPEPARFQVGPGGETRPERASPVAADARRAGDGKANALVKILAGVLDVNYDDLVQREKSRRFRKRLFTTLFAAAGVLLFLSLWGWEQRSKHEQIVEADRQNAVQWEQKGKLKQACVYLADASAKMDPLERGHSAWLKQKMQHDSRSLISELAIFTGHTNQVSDVVFSPDGTQLLTASWDSTMRLWQVNGLPTGNPLIVHTFKEASSEAFLSANFDPTGQKLVCSTYWSALAWVSDFDGGLMGRIIDDHRGRVNDAEFNAQGTQIVTASDDTNACLWDSDEKAIRTFYGHKAGIKSAAFNAAGTQLLTSSYDGTAKVWNVQTGDVITTVVPGQPEGDLDQLNWAAFSPDGKSFVTGGRAQKARIWDSATGKLLTTFDEHAARINMVRFSHKGDLVVSASDDGTAKIWSVKDGTLQASLEGHSGPVLSAAFSPDDTLVATTGGGANDYTVRLWRLSDVAPANLDPKSFTALVKNLPWTLKDDALVSAPVKVPPPPPPLPEAAPPTNQAAPQAPASAPANAPAPPQAPAKSP
jgi:WD40 repeat protein